MLGNADIADMIIRFYLLGYLLFSLDLVNSLVLITIYEVYSWRIQYLWIIGKYIVKIMFLMIF
jgi:hypothetical protein